MVRTDRSTCRLGIKAGRKADHGLSLVYVVILGASHRFPWVRGECKSDSKGTGSWGRPALIWQGCSWVEVNHPLSRRGGELTLMFRSEEVAAEETAYTTPNGEMTCNNFWRRPKFARKMKQQW